MCTLDQATTRHFLIQSVWKPDTAHYLKMTCARLNTDGPADSGVQLLKTMWVFVVTVRDRLRDCPRDCSNGVGTVGTVN